ncbi:MAG TPA: sigma 54-interacting transcriptional regulator [Desulfuromonadales bacterium]|nr:sigma 54-interacting transcriptional regulator [Desulfuromonadales bacterium]
MIDKNEFYREFSSKIFSSPLIDTALESIRDYLKNILPLEVISLVRRDETQESLRVIAHATVGTAASRKEIIATPQPLWLRLRAFDRHSPYLEDENDELSRHLLQGTHLSPFSHLIVPLWRDRNLIGFLSMIAKGSGQYGMEHVDLFHAVASPASVALANAIAHENLLRFRDRLIDENRFLSNELLHTGESEIIGANGGMKHVIELVNQVAPLNNSVLLLGETGTGKEVIANAIHFASPRKGGPFIKVNCGAIPESLIDSELFGHEKGAFTGAAGEKRGRFERADGGTIFLDEIGELPLQAQVRLLRVIQNREIERVGGTRPIPVDIRIIAATHRNLEAMISENRFRADLWFRLNVFPLFIPPLRQRPEDIPGLTQYFLTRKSRELGLGKVPAIAPGALNRLAEYDWPGNVRELENLIERELIRNQGGSILFDTLVPTKSSSSAPVEKSMNNGDTTNLDEVIANHISMILQMTGGKVHGPHGAAVLLGIKSSTLRARMDKLGIHYGRNRRDT